MTQTQIQTAENITKNTVQNINTTSVRHDWTIEEIAEIYNTPLLDLIARAALVHKEFQTTGEVQVNTLLSIKTGACTETCGYCSQSASSKTDVKYEKLLPLDTVIDSARAAKESGSTRFCMGAAWREIKDNQDFEHVLEMVSNVRDMGMEVCTTLGMATAEQALKLKNAGLTAYNHNIDTSREHYPNVVSSRTFDDRLDTIRNMNTAGISVCSGGILGLGESHEDRISFLHTLATMEIHPESIPVNALVPVEGTPMAENPRVPAHEVARMVATVRITVPTAVVRLSAGRLEMSLAEQALCFMAGANSIFAGEKLLTTPNPEVNQDTKMFKELGLTPRVAFKKSCQNKTEEQS
jgi:biotin synthase